MVVMFSLLPSFNPRTRKGATFACNRSGCRLSFNPRTRKGATIDDACAPRLIEFQSTHPQRCDFDLTFYTEQYGRFQSTHPQRCDRIPYPHGRGMPVSIHAPAKVRHSLFITKLSIYSFNPRTRKGATKCIRATEGLRKFQSTHPQRCDSALCSH